MAMRVKWFASSPERGNKNVPFFIRAGGNRTHKHRSNTDMRRLDIFITYNVNIQQISL